MSKHGCFNEFGLYCFYLVGEQVPIYALPPANAYSAAAGHVCLLDKRTCSFWELKMSCHSEIPCIHLNAVVNEIVSWLRV